MIFQMTSFMKYANNKTDQTALFVILCVYSGA